MPLQIGAPDVAFPRLNAFSYWLFLFGGLMAGAGFLTPGGAADFGWFAYAPLTARSSRPGVGADLWIMGLVLSGFGTILGGVNMITTIIYAARARHDDVPDADLHLEHPGDQRSWCCWPSRSWPPRCSRWRPTATSARTSSTPPTAAPMLWQHLFWFFGHPEVYIVALPFFGIITEIIPVFSRKPIFGYKGLVFATIAIAALSMTVWAHHMFATGAVLLPFFSFMSFLIAVPTGVKFFNWIGTMWKGQLTFDTPMLLAVGFLVTFLFGGLTGVLLASPPIDFHVTDTYFVVAHFHYVLFGTVVFAMFAGFYFWCPKMTGRMLDERLGKVHFWLTVHRLPHHVPGPALARHQGHAAPLRRLPADRRLHHAEHGLDDRRVHPGPVDVPVPVERLARLPRAQPAGRGRRPVGLRQLAGVGDVLPAAAAQLHVAAADPLRAAGVRPALPASTGSPHTIRRVRRHSRSRSGWRSSSGSTCSSPVSAPGSVRKIAPMPTSQKLRGSTGSSARTVGGRCSPPPPSRQLGSVSYLPGGSRSSD